MIIGPVFVADNTVDHDQAVMSLIDSCQIQPQIRRAVLKDDAIFDPGYKWFRISERLWTQQVCGSAVIHVCRRRDLWFVFQKRWVERTFSQFGACVYNYTLGLMKT